MRLTRRGFAPDPRSVACAAHQPRAAPPQARASARAWSVMRQQEQNSRFAPHSGLSGRSLVLLLLLLLGAAAPFGCRRKDRLVVAVVPKAQAHVFWQTVHAGAMAAGQELGVDIRWNGPASEIDFTRQITIVEDFINQRVDGIALAPTHGESLVPIVERAAQERVPVTIFDSGIQTEKYVAYVSTDNHKGGVLAAERLGAVLPSGGPIAILGTIPGSISTTEREN